jgi:hypothetical protein
MQSLWREILFFTTASLHPLRKQPLNRQRRRLPCAWHKACYGSCDLTNETQAQAFLVNFGFSNLWEMQTCNGEVL